MYLELSKSDAYKVLSDPDIFKTVAEDGMTDIPMPDSPLYLCGYVPDLMGCFILHRQNSVTVECHVQVLPDFRQEHAEEFGKKVIEWTWKNTDAVKIVAQIPLLYPNVKDFALRMGFEIEGSNTRSFRKNGMLYNQWYLGLSK